ncbi:MAG TPA: 30S ribosomal protein S20 [Patescibacteria group bacterium]
MPLLKHAKKALRASARKTEFNQQVKSKLRTEVSRMRTAPQVDQLARVFSAVDKAVKRHLVHRNKAARLKSQMSRLLPSK